MTDKSEPAHTPPAEAPAPAETAGRQDGKSGAASLLDGCLTSVQATAAAATIMVRRPCADGFTLASVLTAAECAAVIDRCNSAGWGGLGDGNSAQIRTNSRICVKDEAAAALLFERVRSHLPAQLEHEGRQWSLYGLNPHLRLCRYEPGQFFARHVDGYNVNAPGDQSLLTFMIYLNDVPTAHGGATRFYGFDGRAAFVKESLQPTAGTLVVFGPEKEHDGEPLRGGADGVPSLKFLLRSDVMYHLADPSK